MIDEWIKMKKSLPSKYKVVDVNTSLPKNGQLANQFGVNGVPHIVKVSSSGKRYVYNGYRKATDIKHWIEKSVDISNTFS